MNDMQYEKFLNDLTPAQAETTAGGRPIDDGGFSPPEQDLELLASYGEALAVVKREGLSSFSVRSLYVKDRAADGFPVYAQFQVQPADGSRILTTSTKRFDLGGAAGPGSVYIGLRGNFGKTIQQIRLVILRQNPGRDLFVAGKWVRL